MQHVFPRVFWVGFAIYPAYIQHVFQSVVDVVVLVFGVLPVCLVVLGFVSNHLKGHVSTLYSPLPLNFRPDFSNFIWTHLNTYIWRSFLLFNMTWYDPFLDEPFCNWRGSPSHLWHWDPTWKPLKTGWGSPVGYTMMHANFLEIFCRGHEKMGHILGESNNANFW